MPRVLRRPAAALACLLAACGTGDTGDRGNTATGGTVIVAVSFDGTKLIPSTWETSSDRMFTELLFDPLVEIGPGLNTAGDVGFAPRLAERWSWSADSLAIRFTLHADAKWHDGQPVVARDAVAAFRLLKGPYSSSTLRGEMAQIDSVTAPDARTVLVHFPAKSGHQLYLASLILPVPTHLTDAIPDSALGRSEWARRPIGSGPYRLNRREPGVETEFVAVTDHYRGRPGPYRILVAQATSADAAVARVLAGEADVYDALPPNRVAEVAAQSHLRVVRSDDWNYAYAAFNYRDPADTARAHPALRERALRRALTMAIDRVGNVRAVFDTLARVGQGPFARINSPADSNLTQLPYDTAAANRLLDSLGWTQRDAQGFRSRAGRRLRLRAIVPELSNARKATSIRMQEQWRRVGVDVEVQLLEQEQFTQRRLNGNFDIVFGAWGTTPLRATITGTWGGRTTPGWGAQNNSRFESAVADSALARAVRATDPVAARAAYRQAYQTIVDEAAAIWLYEPLGMNAVHRRFELPAWRAEAWWRTLPQWRVDPAQALPRDRAPEAP